MKTYFLDCDFNCNTVLIPTEFKEAWRNWLEYNEHKPNPKLPSFVIRVGGDYSQIEFAHPIRRFKNGKIKKLDVLRD